MKYLDLRKTMRAGVPVAIVLLTLALTAGARETKPSSTARQLTTLLNQFLDAAGHGDRAVFDRFFADDVIYTRSVGKTVDKSDIMKALGQREEGEEHVRGRRRDHSRLRHHRHRQLPPDGAHRKRRQDRDLALPKYGYVPEARRTVAGGGVAGDEGSGKTVIGSR